MKILITGLLVVSMCLNAQAQSASEQSAFKVLDEFMSAFNAYDARAWADTLHFPHYRLASGAMRKQEAGEATIEALQQAINRLKASGWHHSAWVHRNVVHSAADKVHIDTRFRRFRADGTTIATFDSLYIVTRENDKWAIKMRSSFAQ